METKRLEITEIDQSSMNCVPSRICTGGTNRDETWAQLCRGAAGKVLAENALGAYCKRRRKEG
jgi:hypothetical protein